MEQAFYDKCKYFVIKINYNLNYYIFLNPVSKDTEELTFLSENRKL